MLPEVWLRDRFLLYVRVRVSINMHGKRLSWSRFDTDVDEVTSVRISQA